MSMGRRKAKQAPMWVSHSEIPRAPGHRFYEKLNALLLEAEFDRAVEKLCAPYGELTIYNVDALKFNFTALKTDERPLRLVGNLPYNISTPILFHLLDARSVISDMHFMLQKEVVERIAAGPGSKTYGRLSVMLQAYCEVQHLFDIGPGAFNPPPKVDSSIVRLLPKEDSEIAIPDQQRFAQIVSASFAQRRKTLRNNLKGMLTEQQIKDVGIDPGVRAETLAVADFRQLAAVES